MAFSVVFKQLHYDSDPGEITGRRAKAIQISCPMFLEIITATGSFTKLLGFDASLDKLVASKYLNSEAKQNQLSTPSPLQNYHLQLQIHLKC